MPLSPTRSPLTPHSLPRPLVRWNRSLPSGADDVSHLTLSEVRDRLARNERVLNSGLFAVSPASSSAGPSSGFGGRAGGDPASPTDPVRDKLLAVRQQLRAREQALLFEQTVEGVDKMGVEPAPADGRRMSAARSGKQRALESIRAGEGQRPGNGLILPMSQTLELGERDFDNQTAASLDALSLAPQLQPRLRPSDHYTHADELDRAAQSARYAAGLDTRTPGLRGGAYAYAADGDGDARGFPGVGAGFDDGGIFDDDAYDGHEEREYDASGMPLDSSRDDEPATGEMEEDEMDGEDNERFEEGNDEYNLAGDDSREAGPDR
ncbi:hypothetical protein Q5752_001992 [Cryptotrichosporon argae]